jgi:hypothetical protein
MLPGPAGISWYAMPGFGTRREFIHAHALAAVSTRPGSYNEATFHCWMPGACGGLAPQPAGKVLPYRLFGGLRETDRKQQVEQERAQHEELDREKPI